MSGYSKNRRRALLALLTMLLIVVAVASLRSGVIATPLSEVVAHLPAAIAAIFAPYREVAAPGIDPVAPIARAQLIIILAEIRIPRLLLGLLVGAGLAICGVVMQGLFRNPMADPGLLGVSSGAALGAVLSIVFGGKLAAWWLLADSPLFLLWLLPAMAFSGGLASLWVVYRLSLVNGKTDIATMLLAGIAINAILGALIGLLSYIADDAQLRTLIFWSLGSLEITDWRKLSVALLIILPALGWLARYGDSLNANLLGEREAGHLGFDMEKVKQQLIVLVAVVVGVAVCVSGVIGFVGLVVPHLIRLLIGPDHRLLLPAAAIFGATLLVAADMIARSVAAPAEIPIGLITAILGGPFFLWLLVRYHRAKSRA